MSFDHPSKRSCRYFEEPSGFGSEASEPASRARNAYLQFDEKWARGGGGREERGAEAKVSMLCWWVQSAARCVADEWAVWLASGHTPLVAPLANISDNKILLWADVHGVARGGILSAVCELASEDRVAGVGDA
eukprot:scaffold83666_cov33-Tisochrysis_lutea.AAC.2